ncbi:MAG: cell division protein SepF [Thaumarchaeota archaeon 13_1_40CM_3_50_5]|nr:MAG: cell division protein SepF [Candidatus Nitrososphaera sp. 13_1_40CM_48_12]OLC79970.1 MAG: cell division protein SepF [Thaumarchaeota archaeon 13_1_40CM_3_50_5]TLY02089.1 MAG: cell division protein SepF [Nitrososphaerota archaeon]TLY07854.1 MAG: cell division protein SepF [Nitrososphaerota archaeon]TLY10856.1 MAG: cell division protein SepF [Nitrososphaerota archaeon]
MQAQKTPVYLKALTLRDVSDITAIKEDIKKHMILILRVTPLAQKDVEELRKVVEDLYSYAQSVGGDIARLGEERIVITPPGVKIWRGAYDLK